MTQASRDQSPMLEVSNLSISFESPSGKRPGEFTVLKDMSFNVMPREFVSILGPSGCGKTTLLRVIVGLVERQSGVVRIAGKEIYAPGDDVCLVFQSYGLFPWKTVRENIEFGLKIQGKTKIEIDQVVSHFVSMTGLGEFENHYPHQISGGMQQRVGLARALACKPQVLLMDEPFAAVDFQTREHLQGELLKLVEETASTVVFVTHSIDEAVYLGSRVIVFSSPPGRIVSDLPVDLGDRRWTRDVRLTRAFEDYVLEARKALMAGSEMSGG